MKTVIAIIFLCSSLIVNTHADFSRGLKNYELIMQGKKQVQDLNQEELMEVIQVKQLLEKSSSSNNDEEDERKEKLEDACDTALSKCKRYCEADDCYYACKKGYSYCMDERTADDGCYEFKRKCERFCETPNCFDSCYAGKRACY